MPEIHVDLNTRIIRDDHEVFLARPGKQCRMYSQFVEHQKVGPELPGLGLVSGVPIDEQPELYKKVRRSIALRKWIEKNRPDGQKPSLDLNDYENKNSASVAAHISTIRAYFETAKKGDFAIVFPHSYMNDAFIYEFSSEPLEITTLPNAWRYDSDDEKIQGRSLKFISRIPKRNLNQSILETTRQLNTVATLGRSDRDFIYEKSLNNFVNDDRFNSLLRIENAEYDLDNDIVIKSFMKYVAINYLNLEQGLDFKSFKIAAFEDLGEVAPDIASEIHSPGYHKISSLLLIPLLYSVIFELASSVPADALLEAVEQGTITIGNSAAPDDDECTARIHDETLRWFRMRGIDEDWPEACRLSAETARSLGASTDVRVEVNN